ncbi:hypothetical protein GCM10011509_35570 [Ornithinimicrobium pekingense]|uniref:Uncharacterized protein n=2 Tax=Ornithinimicrobium pekingense TaxID=384677 RepID=A0ABQ2FCX5_9MICO|nr:hypothetical protein GCM10011509_35570 [Ornithinimicrobium pekingense]
MDARYCRGECACAAAWGAVPHEVAVGGLLPRRRLSFYCGVMLELSQLDLDEIATALSDQTDYDHRWLIDPKSGQVAFWTSDTGLDGENPVDLGDVDLAPIDPLPPYVWYQDMADFADRISDDAAGRRLARAIAGKGAFRRFKNALYEELPQLLPAWHAFREARANRRAVE